MGQLGQRVWNLVQPWPAEVFVERCKYGVMTYVVATPVCTLLTFVLSIGGSMEDDAFTLGNPYTYISLGAPAPGGAGHECIISLGRLLSDPVLCACAQGARADAAFREVLLREGGGIFYVLAESGYPDLGARHG